MANVLILGANGQLARNATRVFLQTTAATLTLYLRRASRLKNPVRKAKGRDLTKAQEAAK